MDRHLAGLAGDQFDFYRFALAGAQQAQRMAGRGPVARIQRLQGDHDTFGVAVPGFERCSLYVERSPKATSRAPSMLMASFGS